MKSAATRRPPLEKIGECGKIEGNRLFICRLGAVVCLFVTLAVSHLTAIDATGLFGSLAVLDAVSLLFHWERVFS